MNLKLLTKTILVLGLTGTFLIDPVSTPADEIIPDPLITAAPIQLAEFDDEDSFDDFEPPKKKKRKKRKKRRRKKRRSKRIPKEYRMNKEDPAKSGYVGLLLGLAKPSLTAADLGISLGANVGLTVADDWLVGLFVNSWAQKTVSGSTEITSTILPVGIEGNYVINGFHFGARVGLTIESASSGTFTTSESELTFGAQAGYDYIMSNDFSLGGEASFMNVSGTPTGYSIINGHFSAKYWW